MTHPRGLPQPRSIAVARDRPITGAPAQGSAAASDPTTEARVDVQPRLWGRRFAAEARAPGRRTRLSRWTTSRRVGPVELPQLARSGSRQLNTSVRHGVLKCSGVASGRTRLAIASARGRDTLAGCSFCLMRRTNRSSAGDASASSGCRAGGTQRAGRSRRRRRTAPGEAGWVPFSGWIRVSRCMLARSGGTPRRKCGSARGARRGARTLRDSRCMSPRRPQPLRGRRRRRMRSGGSRCGRWTRTGRRSRDKGECSAPTPARRSRRGRHRRSSYTWRSSRRRARYRFRGRGGETEDDCSVQPGYSSLRQARGSSGSGFGVRASRNEWYGATNGSGADTV
jgi:hypothetical protein